MKSIIGGKVFNTETSTLLAEWDNNHMVGDLHYCEEQLWLSPKGQHFVTGVGGAGSSYATKTGSNTWSGGEDLRLVSLKEALEWCEEKNISPDKVVKHFGDMLKEG